MTGDELGDRVATAAPDKDSVLYPVPNKDYRDWRAKRNQCGNFRIYTDRVNVKLDSPIRMAL